MDTGIRLLISRKPAPDESLMGYLIRLTELNGYETPSWILSLSGIDYMELQWKFTFMFYPSHGLKRLAKLTGSTQFELLSLLYLPAKSPKGYKVSPDEYNFYGAFLNRSVIRPHCPKICSRCLIEFGYCFRVWDCSLVTVCPLHKCILIDQCPGCENRISCVRNSVSICACGCDWREMAPEFVSEVEVAVSRRIYQLCRLLPAKPDSSKEACMNPIYSLSLRDMAVAITFIARLYGDISWATGSPSKSIKWLNKDLHELYTRAYMVFENWPSNYHQFLKEQAAGDEKLEPYDGKLDTALKREFRSIYKGLYKKMLGDQYNFLRKSFVDFLIERWKADSPEAFNSDPETAGDEKGSYVSLKAARRSLNINHQSLFNLIKTGEIKFSIQNHDSALFYSLRLSDIEKIRASI